MVYNKKKLFIYLLIPLIILGIICGWFIFNSAPTASSSKSNAAVLETGNLKINERIINIEIASNDKQWYQGLSNRDSLCSDCGMLFDFPFKDKLDFVMRDMKFPLDLIFIEDNKILNIAENLAPEGNVTENIYSSYGEANRVLEVNAGYCNKYGIKVGDLIYLAN